MPDRIEELEAQAAVHRAGLVSALAGLAQATQPAALMGTDLAQTAAKAALDTAKRNPLGAALVGVGLALLLTQSAKPATAKSDPPQTDPPQTDPPQTDPPQTDPPKARDAARPRGQSAAAPGDDGGPGPDAQTMRLTLHAGLGHLSPEARKRVIRKRIEALHAQDALEKRAASPVARLKAHPFAALLAVAGIGVAAATLWPRRTNKAREDRDRRLRAAQTQLHVEEARDQPFPGTSGPASATDLQSHERL